MEKIQSAIAKARATRGTSQTAQPSHAGAPEQGRTQSRGRARPGDADRAVDAAWAALPVFDPDERRLRANRIVAATQGKDAAEFDKLRTRMLQGMQARGWKRVAVTSPGPACGKTTIVLNLGFSMARQRAMRTVIGEVDLRRPSQARILGTPRTQDFVRVLDGIDPFEAHALRPRDNLAIGMVRGPAEGSAELLQGPRIGAALDLIQETYAPTLMLFDMPPFQVSDDTMAFVDKVDCVLIAAAAGRTTVDEIDVCERELSGQTEVLGVLLNKCRYVGTDQSYDYYD